MREIVVWGCLLLLAWMLWTRAEAAATFRPLPGPPGGIPAETAGAGDPAARQVTPVRPARLVVPAVGMDAQVIDLGLNQDGTLEVPRDFELAGWWSGGATPGEAGPAVIVGHLDSRRGGAVFKRLPELSPGDEIFVEDADGSSVRFTVTHLEQHPKDAFPTQAVYGPTRGPTLRLVTCGGPFRRGLRSYRDNIIAFAEITP